jgi:SAM-dependent methyltransferase
MQEAVVYQGRDLEAMSFADRYHRWILRDFRPYLGARLVEVGAGAGSFSELLLESRPESLTLVEPSAEMFPLLEARVAAAREGGANVSTYNSIFRSVADEIAARERPDSIIYVNVLEHIADDEGELAAVSRALTVGGRAFVFVPALGWLYGDFDREVGHVRRYAKAELEGKCERAGLRVVASRYFDLLGVAPWWVKYRLLKSSELEPRAVRLYDRYCVPLASAAERLVRPPLGKNILLVAEKI